MWKAIRTPDKYKPSAEQQWCIIDDVDGDIHNFYFTEEEALEALKELIDGVLK